MISDCKQKAILPPKGRIALSANERIAEFLNFAIQAKFAYANKMISFVMIPRDDARTRARQAFPCLLA